MRRADRLFQIVGILSRRRFATAATLAEALDVSKRTIYRDVLDLCASGVPVVGEAGVGYQLDSSYRLPPLMFNADGVEALVIGMRMVESWGDCELRTAARAVLEKVNGVVPEKERVHLKSAALFSLRFGRQEEASEHLGAVRRAVNEKHKLRLIYRAENDAVTERIVCPLGLYFWGRSWTLAAWCERRTDFRSFRTDRIEAVSRTGESFELISPCTLDDYIASVKQRSLRCAQGAAAVGVIDDLSKCTATP